MKKTINIEMNKGNIDEAAYEKVPTYEAVVSEINKVKPPKDVSQSFGVRHVQTILLFASLSIGFISRGHLSMTIVAMTDVKNKNHSHCSNHSCFSKIINENSNLHYNVISKGIVYLDTFDNSTTITEVNVVDKSVKVETGIKANTKNKKKDYVDNINIEKDFLHEVKNKEVKDETQSEISGKFSVYRVYTWPKSKQEIVLSSFYMGYSIMMFPMGLISQRFGGKIPLQVALLVNGIISFITPWMAMMGGWMAVSGCRFVQGLTQAAYYPSLHTLLAKWVPLSERGRLSTYVYTGTTFGTVIGFQISGLLADSPMGWPSTFWLTGVINIVSFILLSYLGAATPAEHPKISEKEKEFIMGEDYGADVKKKHKTPWLSIMTSKRVWALYTTQVGSALGFIFLLGQMPTYMFHILHVDIKKSGLYSSLPYIAMYFTGLAFGFLSDFCTNRKILSIENARIISNSIAMIGPAVFMTACSYTSHTGWAVTLLVLSMGTHAGVHTGWMINHIDLAPNYSGTMMAAGNTLGNVCGLILPVLVSNIVTDVKDQSQWRILFILIAVISFVSNAIFVFFMSAEIQPWNYEKKEKTELDFDEKQKI